MRVKFGPWTPDQPDLDSGGLEECVNCMPLESGYGAVRQAQTLSGTSSAPLNIDNSFGAYGTLGPNEGSHLFIGTSRAAASSSASTGGIHLYRYFYGVNSTAVSRALVDRTATYASSTDAWSFTRFGNSIIAASDDNPMQILTSGATQFRDMSASASAPNATTLATVRDFVFAGNLGPTTGNRVQWCQINNAQRWTPSPRNQSDFQDLPETGDIIAMTGGDFAAIMTMRSVWRATYVGSPVIFRFDEVAPNVQCLSRRSAARYQNLTFFLARSGFQVFDGQQCIPIGAGKVDRYVLDDSAVKNNEGRVIGVIDPVARLYVVSLPDRLRLLVYNFGTQGWSLISKAHRFPAASIMQGGRALEQSPVDVTFDAGPSDNRLGIGLFTADTGDANYNEFISDTRMTATFATGEAQLFPDHRGFVKGVRPLIQGNSSTSITAEVGKRNKLNESVSYGSAVTVNANGMAPLRADARFHRVRLNVANGFDRAIGFDLDATRSGKR